MRKIKELVCLAYKTDFICRQIAASLKMSVGVIYNHTQATALSE